MTPRVLFSVDVDWAAEAVIADTLELLAKFRVKATIFATHKSSVLAGCDQGSFELGIHPNFNPLLEGRKTVSNLDEVLQKLLAWYPQAKGARSHSMTQSTLILNKLAEIGLLYDANLFLPYFSGMHPFRLWNGLVRIPYNWEDDIHWGYGYGFDSCRLDFNSPGINVLDFHPIHVYLNTENAARYEAAKPYYDDPCRLLDYRNTSNVPGARDLLVSTLQWIRDNRVETDLMAEVAREFSAEGSR